MSLIEGDFQYVTGIDVAKLFKKRKYSPFLLLSNNGALRFCSIRLQKNLKAESSHKEIGGFNLPDVALDILINIIAAILFFIIGLLVNKAYTYFRLKQPLSKIMGSLADNRKCTVLVVPKLYSDTENIKLKRPDDRTEFIQWPVRLPLFAESDAEAMMYAYNMLLKCGKKAEKLDIKSDAEITGREKEGDILCIGAGSNALTKYVLTTINPHLTFEQQVSQTSTGHVQVFGTAIIDRKTGERWAISPTHDFGLIIRLKNPYNQDTNCVILAGLGPIGTAASGYYLSTHWRRIYDSLRSEKGVDGNYAVLLRVNVADPTDINLVKTSIIS